jgi:hypothetical protein
MNQLILVKNWINTPAGKLIKQAKNKLQPQNSGELVDFIDVIKPGFCGIYTTSILQQEL